MTPLSIMHCRNCNKYIGGKQNLEDYFFWCDKECFETDAEVIRIRNLHSMENHENAYKGKPRFGMTGSVDSDVSVVGNENKKEKKNIGNKKKKADSVVIEEVTDNSESIIDKVITDSEDAILKSKTPRARTVRRKL